MGLRDKAGATETSKAPNLPESKTQLTEKETSFIIAKLRQATYTGSEFETFYNIMSKLQTFIEKK